MILARARVWMMIGALLALGAGCGSDTAPEDSAPPPEPIAKTEPLPEPEPPPEPADEPEKAPEPAPPTKPQPKAAPKKAPTNPIVEIQTSKGDIRVELNPDKAPLSVENFLQYVNDKFYDGTVFHRVIPNFMIQGGGLTTEMVKKETRDPIQNEAKNGLRNLRGTVAMARTMNPHSATAQFYINHADNAGLDQAGQPPNAWGYAVFGKVVDGMDVVDAIANTPTGFAAGMQDVPTTPIVIESIRRVN